LSTGWLPITNIYLTDLTYKLLGTSPFEVRELNSLSVYL